MIRLGLQKIVFARPGPEAAIASVRKACLRPFQFRLRWIGLPFRHEALGFGDLGAGLSMNAFGK